jgi:hypothetical protein
MLIQFENKQIHFVTCVKHYENREGAKIKKIQTLFNMQWEFYISGICVQRYIANKFSLHLSQMKEENIYTNEVSRGLFQETFAYYSPFLWIQISFVRFYNPVPLFSMFLSDNF